MDPYDVVTLTRCAKRFCWSFLTDITNTKALHFLLPTLLVFLNPPQSLGLQITLMTLMMTMVYALMIMFYALISAACGLIFNRQKPINNKTVCLLVYCIHCVQSLLY